MLDSWSNSWVSAQFLSPLMVKSSIGIIVHLKYIVSFRFVQRNNLIIPDERYDYADSCRVIDRDKLVFFEKTKYNILEGAKWIT